MSHARTLRSVATNAWRVLADVAAIGLWTVLVTLLALTASWSWLQFYTLLLLGVGCYVVVTTAW
ncbi:hypothetical protein [Natronobeatus ordinarius]|uniref:hypothetical protein n=1 Tax=Natronobeatus ordinarius TaxID=2963433 RepID=UPI0020CF56AB|nr:hypothetical protein [Natronobeatus ordinarius]